MKTAHLLVTAWAIFALMACGTGEDASTQNTLKVETEDEKTLYALGVLMASNGPFKGMFSAEEVELIKKGLGDGLLGQEPLVDVDSYSSQMGTYIQQRMMRAAEPERARGKAFLEKEAAAPGAVQTESGLVYVEMVPGTGATPKETDTIKVHYHGTLIDGTVFDSSVERGEPIVHQVNRFVPGWQEGLQLMKVGGKARLVVPPELAYGDRPVGNIPPGSTLIFEVELLGIE